MESKDKLYLVTQQHNDYEKIVRVNGSAVQCYSKKQLKKKHPSNDYKLEAECAEANQDSAIGKLVHGGADLPLYQYKSLNRFAYAEKGFAEVSSGSYVAVMKKVLALRIVLIAVIAAAAVVLALALSPAENPVKEMMGIDPNAGQETEAFDEQTPIGIPGYESFVWEAGDTTVPVKLENPEDNPCYFRISLYLGDDIQTGELIYQTELIEPGTGIYEIELDEPLKAGIYDAVLSYEAYSIPDQNALNGANIELQIEVE